MSSADIGPSGAYHIRDASSSSCSMTGPPALRACSLSSLTIAGAHAQQQDASGDGGAETACAVCGDGHAKLHYGVLACYGCKGFFRRTLTGKYRYVCRFGNDCVVDKYQRNSCRCCRFKRCLEVGMDPKAVRPDRDLTGKQRVSRVRKRALDEELINHMMRLQGDDWSRKIPAESKMLLMQLLNIESKVTKGDCVGNRGGAIGSPPQWPLPPPPAEGTINSMRELSLRELFEQKPSLNTRRTEMCYEPYRMAKAEELPKIAHRGAIAAVDWVESLAELVDTVLMDTQDKIALVKACYAPLTIFNFSARTAQNTRNPDILCLCSLSYVPRKLPPDFNGSNHLSNNLIDRTLNELVAPLRKLCLREEEVVPLKAIIILDPNAKNLSPEAQRGVAELRDRVQDMLFQVVKELHPVYNAASRFGNLLLLLPTITTLSGVMCENMQFCQVFGWTDPLLNELFDTETEKGDFVESECSLFGDGSTSLGISYSPPMLGLTNPADISLNPRGQFSSSPSPGGFLPNHPTPSSSSSSALSTTSSTHCSASSSPSCLFSRARPLKCEISTQTESSPGLQQIRCRPPLTEGISSSFHHYTDPPSSSTHYEQQQNQQMRRASGISSRGQQQHLHQLEDGMLSSLEAFFDNAELDLQHNHQPAMMLAGPRHQHQTSDASHGGMTFASHDPLLFGHCSSPSPSPSGHCRHHDDDLFALMEG